METNKLRITSKRLTSGRFQVNFSKHIHTQEFYGYLLAESRTPVREVVEKIIRHIDAMQYSERYLQRNLFSLTHREANSGKILIFKSDKRKAA
jgi:hypothetical protein